MRVRLLLLAVWFGLLAGILEIVLVQLALRSGVQVRLSADYVWMAPVADLGFALAGVLGVMVLGRWRPAWGGAGVALGVLTALLVLSVVLHVETLHRGAVLLLAAGIGSQTGRLVKYAWARRIFIVVPITALVMAGLVVNVAVSLRRELSRRESDAASRLRPPPAGAMNVLLLILDTVREESTGLGDSSLTTTPALDAFARRGVTFDRAIAPAPWTLPSHASFFTSRLPQELTAGWTTPLDRVFPTLAEYLAQKGYLTAGFVGNLLFASRASGLGRGFIHYDDYQVNLGQILLSSSIGRALAGATWLRRVVGYHELANRRSAFDVTDDFLSWQAGRPRGRPFFAFLNFFDAHEPYFPEGRSGSILWPGARWAGYEHVVGLFSGANAWFADKWKLAPDQAAIHAAAYRRAVSKADREVGRLLAELERRGVLDSTLVIIAGDHGEQLGEHHLFEHINSLYLPALHVPLVVVSPGVPRGVRVPQTVGLVDLPATVVDLVGLSRGAPFSGRSLAVHWRAASGVGSVVPDTVFSMLQQGLVRNEAYPIHRGKEMFSLLTNDHHYILNGDNSEELYDLRVDPGEMTNLARTADTTTLNPFRRGLARLRAGM